MVASLATLCAENLVLFLTHGLYDESIEASEDTDNLKSNLKIPELLNTAAWLRFSFCNPVSHTVW